MTRALLGMFATESFNAMTKEARATAPSMSRLLISVTNIWGRHICRGWERAECEGQLTPRAQVELDRLRDSASHLAAIDSGPFDALVECGAMAGRRYRVTVEPDTPPTCECSHFVVTGLPCSHILAAAKCLSALPRRPNVAATSLCHPSHTSVSEQLSKEPVSTQGKEVWQVWGDEAQRAYLHEPPAASTGSGQSNACGQCEGFRLARFADDVDTDGRSAVRR